MAGGAKGRSVENGRGWTIYAWRPDDAAPESEPTYYTASPAGSFDWKKFPTLDEARAYVAGQRPVRRVKVELTVSLPPDVVTFTEDELEDWLEYELRGNGALSDRNPFSKHAPDVVDMWVDA